MQIMINLPQDLEEELLRQSAQSNISLQTLIIQALCQLTQSVPAPVLQWSNAILSYQGISDFPTFESYRNELLLTQEMDLF